MVTARSAVAVVASAVLMTTALGAAANSRPDSDVLSLRGRHQLLHLYGDASSGTPVIVSSGDGGWIHLAPHVSELLASHGYFVVGFDAKSYLESFTSGAGVLRPEDEPGDYRALAKYAARGTGRRPVLVGVSEGAGLSVLAATGQDMRATVEGVVALGLSEKNELGWRWKDDVIYLTHGRPKEPAFDASCVVGKVAPLPLAAIHSTSDEFTPLADVRKILGAAGDPKKLWVVPAGDHRFSDNLGELDRRLLDALAWVGQNQTP